jgi:hypothetical protein
MSNHLLLGSKTLWGYFALLKLLRFFRNSMIYDYVLNCQKVTFVSYIITNNWLSITYRILESKAGPDVQSTPQNST